MGEGGRGAVSKQGVGRWVREGVGKRGCRQESVWAREGVGKGGCG